MVMFRAAVGSEGGPVTLQLREATPGDVGRATARLQQEQLAIACHEPELLADLLHAAAEIGKSFLSRVILQTSPVPI